jgi:hypothetical protein
VAADDVAREIPNVAAWRAFVRTDDGDREIVEFHRFVTQGHQYDNIPRTGFSRRGRSCEERLKHQCRFPASGFKDYCSLGITIPLNLRGGAKTGLFISVPSIITSWGP